MSAEDATKNTNGKRKTCFVVGPIGAAGSVSRNHADWLLKGVILPTFKEHFPDFDVVRSDRINEPGMIDAQMIGYLLDAELVVADMSEHNANAFYEMGIRHMAALPIIHMFKKGTVIPFDVKPYRSIEFDYADPDDLVAAKTELKAFVEQTQKPDFKVDNPITRARGVMRISENATPEMQLVWQELNDLKRQIAERDFQQIPKADDVELRITVPLVELDRVISLLHSIESYSGLSISRGQDPAVIHASFGPAIRRDELVRIQRQVRHSQGFVTVLSSGSTDILS
ncbi:hypothetical protein ATY76_28455 [Rhizobium sp. R339]|uniref:hypothetical protein n=1 Tax=Rhizobium sp. R339 TaxID=1764273 RepID=UPI000B53677B|nr:hypothetical protein [Rhizobium sp. R339]OWV73907.1 hypothetical protein ATY76_28455 [Rhizobium sp. R339]